MVRVGGGHATARFPKARQQSRPQILGANGVVILAALRIEPVVLVRERGRPMIWPPPRAESLIRLGSLGPHPPRGRRWSSRSLYGRSHATRITPGCIRLESHVRQPIGRLIKTMWIGERAAEKWGKPAPRHRVLLATTWGTDVIRSAAVT